MQKADRPGLAELRRRVAALEGRLPSQGFAQARLAPAPASANPTQGPAFLPEQPALALSRDEMVSGNAPVERPSARLPLGAVALDGLFSAPGLLEGALHEVVSTQSRDGGALVGFACGLLVRFMAHRSGPVLWVQDPNARREAGELCGPGLFAFGLDPSRLVLVQPRRLEEILWAMEEGATCGALSAVVGEIHGGHHKALDLTATRRLALRAARAGLPLLLLRHAAPVEPTAAATRWVVRPRPSHVPDLLRMGPHPAVGAAAWQVDLTRNRDGCPGRVDLEWDHVARSFSASADSFPSVRGSGGRSGSASASAQA